ncbi:MAG: cytochrome d ubiquinol oxidase subunit II [Chloroflexi bacterium]|nr:cytochrome d ubiquinol oxidase subunit II [Chloroflexota bacterium]MBP7045017.1 cytochrome d ubiquinol oxidase subunit II [Chloroflexota bacterium]
MDLNVIWFVLIAVLYIGFFLLEGFDFGVGILLPFLGKDDKTRRMMINTIGPHWDGNEVWLLTAGGATFAAFPNWYATMFSSFYLALFLLLITLILRGVAFEFRSKDAHPRWRSVWDWSIFVGSLVPPLLLGVAFANMMRGMPIDATMTYTGGFFNLLNPYALVAGLMAVAICVLHGAIFLSLKTTAALQEASRNTAWRVWPITVVLVGLAIVITYTSTNIVSHLGINPGIEPIAGIVTLLVAGYFIRKRMDVWAFIMTGLTIALTVVTAFMILFPQVMVSSTDPAYSLTIYNASSSPYTLKVMTIVALIFVPIVLGYQIWSFWVFRERITENSALEY